MRSCTRMRFEIRLWCARDKSSKSRSITQVPQGTSSLSCSRTWKTFDWMITRHSTTEDGEYVDSSSTYKQACGTLEVTLNLMANLVSGYRLNGQDAMLVTTNRDEAMQSEELSLLGFEHPIVKQLMERHRSVGAVDRGVSGRFANDNAEIGVLTFWHVHIHGSGGQYHQRVIPLGVDADGERSRNIERLVDELRELSESQTSVLSKPDRLRLVAVRLSRDAATRTCAQRAFARQRIVLLQDS